MAKKQPVNKSDLTNSIIAQRKSEGATTGQRPKWGRGYMLLPQEEEQVVLWHQQNIGPSEMSRRLNCSPTTITRTLTRRGLNQ